MQSQIHLYSLIHLHSLVYLHLYTYTLTHLYIYTRLLIIDSDGFSIARKINFFIADVQIHNAISCGNVWHPKETEYKYA